MAYEQKPNTGSLFRNDRKEKDTQPDYTGSANVEGLGDCYLDAWINTAKDGSKYMSVKIKPKENRHSEPTVNSYGQTREQADLDDDCPF